MSLETAKRLGFSTEPLIGGPTLSTANGQVIKSVGETIARCSFAEGWDDDPKLPCVFRIIETLSVPLIMGLKFLEKTKTLTKHRDRLVDQFSLLSDGSRVFSTGKNMRSIACRLDEHVDLADIDTGSDLDVLSESFARAQGFNPDEVYHEVEFADGSTALTSGTIRVNFAVGIMDDSTGFIPRSQTIEVEFHVLADLSSDILVEQDTIEQLNIFTGHYQSLVTRTPRAEESEVCIIRYIGKVEKMIGALSKYFLKHELLICV